MAVPGEPGMVRTFGEGIGSWMLTEPGEYFLGRDTVAPTLEFADEGLTEGDSSWISVLPRDNVANLALSVTAWGVQPDPGRRHFRGNVGVFRNIRSGWHSRGPPAQRLSR